MQGIAQKNEANVLAMILSQSYIVLLSTAIVTTHCLPCGSAGEVQPSKPLRENQTHLLTPEVFIKLYLEKKLGSNSLLSHWK